MANLGIAITKVHSSDEDVQRRGRLLIIIAMSMILLDLAFIPVIMLTNSGNFGLLTILVAIVIFAGVVFLGRAGLVNLGAYILIGVCIVAIAAAIPSPGATKTTAFYMVLPVLLAGVLLPPIQIWSALICALISIGLGVGLLPAELREEVEWRQALLGAPLLLIIVALVSFLSARTTAGALAAARQARVEAEAAGKALVASNAMLEARVEDRTAALRQIADEQRAVAGQLKASLEAQQDLNRVIAELVVPIIPVSAGTLVVPLVGNIDSARAEQLLGAVLAQIEADRAYTIVLDVTGVAVMDTQVAAAMLRVATAARLMGADTLLVGIRPEVAQTLVHLGVDLAALRTAATLQDGLAALGVTHAR